MLKRAKATTDVLDAAAEPIQSNAGWDAAFAPLKQNNELVVNGFSNNNDNAASSDAEDYENFAAQGEASSTSKKSGKRSKSKTSKASKAPEWRFSKPVGGRMIDVDPVFSNDEK